MKLIIDPKKDHWEVTLNSLHNPTLEGAIKDIEHGVMKLKEEYETFKKYRKVGLEPKVASTS